MSAITLPPLPLNAATLIERIRVAFSKLPDTRGQSNNLTCLIKQDCELGDDLYCPPCDRVLSQHANFVFTCKPDSHATLYGRGDDFSRISEVTDVVRARRIGKKHVTDTYRFVNQVPLRNTDDALRVKWLELVTTAQDGTVLFSNAWATSPRITEENVASLAAVGRTRWKIENENNNTLKTKGYRFEHSYGHGKQFLANLFTTMILLAFLVHTTLEWADAPYRAVRNSLPSRRTFFEHLRALIHHLPFDDWNHLMCIMGKSPDPEPHDTG